MKKPKEMFLTRQQLEAREENMLAPYAVLSAQSQGREHIEEEDPYRTCFQRDRDRIIHAKAFRRLAGKTQVFIAGHGDHYRDRLSHSLEVAQISRDIARSFACNEDLAEAIALAHDLGHTPFAHAGQDALNEKMQEFGLHFEHNEQSHRVVTPLNLTREVTQGLLKHQSHYDQRGKEISGKTLEAQIVDLADEIAYHSHDIDDGIRSGLLTPDRLRTLAIWDERTVKTPRDIINILILDLCLETERRLVHHHIDSPQDVLNFDHYLVGFSDDMQPRVAELRAFLNDHMYMRPEVLEHTNLGKRVIIALFDHYLEHPDDMPEKVRARIGKGEKGGEKPEIVIKDYIAGMTDAYALSQMPKKRYEGD